MSTPEPLPAADVLLRHGLRVAIQEALAEEARGNLDAARHAAELAFRPVRGHGTTQQEVLLPGGMKAGLISILRGGTSTDTDEDALFAVAATNEPADLEDFVQPSALTDPRVLALLSAHLPELVGRRIKADAAALYAKEIEENNGKVLDRYGALGPAGERVQVAVITHHEATGRFSYRPAAKGAQMIREALEAGTLTLDGEYASPAAGEPRSADEEQDAAPVDDAGERIERALSRGRGATREKLQHPPTDEQQAILDAKKTGENIVISARAGSGKALRYDQPILTPGGWRQISTLEPGDAVTGSDGCPVTVTGVYPQGLREMFEVVVSDGTVIVADADHLWLTTTTKHRDYHKPPQVRTTAQIAATVRLPSGRINHYLPMLSGPVRMPQASLPLDPYLLGVLLGDGGLSGARTMLSTPDPEILATVEAALPAGVRAVRVEGSACDYRLTSGHATVPGRRGFVNPLPDILRDLGLRGSHSSDKHVPGQYLCASAEQRLALLQGLLDTDGSAAGVAVEFSSASKMLAEQVMWLAQSLGGFATTTERQPWHTYKGERRAGQVSYRMLVSLPAGIAPFRLVRKRDALRPRTRSTPYRQITEVRPAPAAEAVCISVDAPDELYLTAGCVPTHNTSSLVMIGSHAERERGLYVAFNRAIVTDAKPKFGPDVQVSTAHALAMAAVGQKYRDRLNGARVPASQAARILGINEPLRVAEDRVLAPAQQARLVLETVDRFCRSADPELTKVHVPHKPGLDTPEAMSVLRSALVPRARKAWDDLTATQGQLRFSHDVYLKLYGLSRPQLAADYVLYDEAQDADAVVQDIVLSQQGTQLIAVGDQAQAIYAWRGAIDAMEHFPAKHRLTLSKSFRFGSAIATEANKWLAILEAEPPVTGFDRISSMVRSLERADAVLCRTNAGTISEVLRATAAGHSAALVGGGKDIRSLAEAAAALVQGRGTSHPELYAFQTWGEVQDHAENDPSGSDLKVLVSLVDEHGPEKIIDIVDSLTDEKHADIVISTAHKAKGREWASVRIASDFRPPKGKADDPDSGQVSPADARLAYVAVTRARLSLDRTGLAWVDDYVPERGAAA